MAGVEEATSFRGHLNRDLDPDNREEGVSSTAEEAAKKKRRKKKGKEAVSAVQEELDKESGTSVDEVVEQLERQAWRRKREKMMMRMEMVMLMAQLGTRRKRRRRENQKFKQNLPQSQYVTCILMVYFPKDKSENTHLHKMGE